MHSMQLDVCMQSLVPLHALHSTTRINHHSLLADVQRRVPLGAVHSVAMHDFQMHSFPVSRFSDCILTPTAPHFPGVPRSRPRYHQTSNLALVIAGKSPQLLSIAAHPMEVYHQAFPIAFLVCKD